MSKLQEMFEVYNQSRGEVLTLSKALASAEAAVGVVEQDLARERALVLEKVERAKREAQETAERTIRDLQAQIEVERVHVETVRKNLKRAKAVMVQASNDLPKLLHSDMAGVVGKREDSEPSEAAAAQ